MRGVSIRRGTTSSALAFAALLLGARPMVARAAPPEAAKAQAHASLREGNALLEHGRPAEALAKFVEAYRLFPSPKLHYNIGQAESLIPGREVEAYQSLCRFVGEAKDASPELRAAAEAQRRQVRSKVGLVTVTAEPAAAELLVDGTKADRALAEITREAPLVLGVGMHRLTLKKGAAISAPETVTIAGGDVVNVRLSLGAPAAASPVPVASARLPAAVATPLLAATADSTSPSSMLVAAPAETRADSANRPVLQRAWFWGVVAGTAVAVGAGAFLLTRSSATSPMPTMGTFKAN